MTIPYWRLSGFYFFYFASLGVLSPYWSLYLKEVGCNTAQIGELFALMAGTKIISPNLWGWIADHSQKSMPIIRFTSFVSTVLFAGFLYVDRYWGFALITLGFSFFWNAALPQFEAVTLFHLREKPQRYSQIRLWGSIGFIVAVLGIGVLLDSLPLILLPIGITTLLGLGALVTLLIPEARPHEYTKASLSLLQIIKKPEVIAFFMASTLLQFAHTPYYVFYSIYLKQLHYSATLTGSLWALGIIAEVLLFLLMQSVLRCFSLRRIFLCSIFLAVIRWLLIAKYADNLPILIAAQILHAATFGGTHVAAIHLVHRYFGHTHQGKGQALYGSLCYGLGGMLGGVYSGYFWETAGSEFVFTLAAMACGVALIIAVIWIGKVPHIQTALG